MFPVSPQKVAALQARFRELGIREEDIDESFVRSGGKGGQNVNKVSTCVVLVHRPTGTAVKCQRERSQALNRFLARQLLADKIDRARRGAESEEAQRIEKIRRQKRRRSRRAKEEMLAEKHALARSGRGSRPPPPPVLRARAPAVAGRPHGARRTRRARSRAAPARGTTRARRGPRPGARRRPRTRPRG